MKPEDVRVCVVRIEGTNCEDEMAYAFRSVGAQAEEVHLKQLIKQAPADMCRNLEDYDVLAFPGGFSAGDYVRAGALFAARIKASIGGEVKRFVEAGKPVLGVCNGFQILVELGLLPAIEETMTEQPTAALYTNDSGRFECRPTVLRNDNRGKCIFIREIPEQVRLPRRVQGRVPLEPQRVPLGHRGHMQPCGQRPGHDAPSGACDHKVHASRLDEGLHRRGG